MDILYLLIPLSAVLVLGVVAVFGWALQRGQFDDLDREGERILRDDGEAIDVDQHRDSTRPEQFGAEPQVSSEASNPQEKP